MNQVNKLMLLVQSFFQEYLLSDRGLSKNTVLAYRDTMKLFILFESDRQKKPITKVGLDDVKAEAVLQFLNQLENKRNNSIVTRNLRLSALKSFALFLTTKDLVRAGEYQRIISLPLKMAPRKVIDYLEVNEINAILNEIEPCGEINQRDHVLLSLLYNTGARVQEICDLTVVSVTFGSLPFVTLVGKGNKTRRVPIWQETAMQLTNYLHSKQISDTPEARLFLNARREPISRFGIRYIIKKRVERATKHCPSLATKSIGPHTFRHTIAMHLLQAGVDLSVIMSWLGHVNLETTHAYIEIDMKMKRKVLEAYSPSTGSKSLKELLDKNKDIVTWLSSI